MRAWSWILVAAGFALFPCGLSAQEGMSAPEETAEVDGGENVADLLAAVEAEGVAAWSSYGEALTRRNCLDAGSGVGALPRFYERWVIIYDFARAAHLECLYFWLDFAYEDYRSARTRLEEDLGQRAYLLWAYQDLGRADRSVEEARDAIRQGAAARARECLGSARQDYRWARNASGWAADELAAVEALLGTATEMLDLIEAAIAGEGCWCPE